MSANIYCTFPQCKAKIFSLICLADCDSRHVGQAHAMAPTEKLATRLDILLYSL